jgi:methyltransferase
VSVLWIALALVAAERCIELIYLRRAQRRDPPSALLHASWLIAMAVLIAPQTPPNWWLLGGFAALAALRVWSARAPGPTWCTRILTVAEVAVLPLAFGAVWIALVFALLDAALPVLRAALERARSSRRID